MKSISKSNKLFTEAQGCFHAGDLPKARTLCQKLIRISPNHADAYNMMGLIAHLSGKNEEGATLIQKAIQLNPNASILHNNFGNILFAQGKTRPALKAFLKSAELQPDFAKAHYNIGLTSLACNEYDQAINGFKQAIQLKPGLGAAYWGLGNALMKKNQVVAAIDSFTRAIEIDPADQKSSVALSIVLTSVGNTKAAKTVLKKALTHLPDNPDILFNLGNIFKDENQTEKAIEYFQRALQTMPANAKILYNLGTTFMEAKQYPKALPYLEKALKQSPNAPDILNNLGLINFNSGNFKTAIDYYSLAIEKQSGFFKAYNNAGIAYKKLEQGDKAMANFKKAIALSPEFTEAYHNLAEVLWEGGDLDGAAENCRQAISLNPDLTQSLALYAYIMKYQCNWTEFEKASLRIDDLLQKELNQGDAIGETPFLNLIRTDDPVCNRKVADAFARSTSRSAKALNINFSFDPPPQACKKITIGYISANFRNHPMAHLLASLFKRHDRNDFQVNCYSLGPDDKSIYRQRFMKDSDIFRDIRDMTYQDAARQIYDDKVDILVDLMGYTKGNKMEIAALRPAPVQVRYMGLAGTTGGNFFDYIITDEIVTPRDQSVHYSEKFIYMPHTYQINDQNKKISETSVSRKQFDLPEDSFVFCSFNQSYKIDPVIFEAWMDILKRTKNSVLWLMPKDNRAKENLLARAREQGINKHRLVFAGRLPLEEHIARLRLADLALDTRTIGGAATTSDSLWGGLPVITLLGRNFASRMSASILSAIGLEELVTNTVQEYAELAISLAADRTKLGTLRNKLKTNIDSMPLFNTPAFTANLEQAFKKIWEIYRSGEAPRIIDLKKKPTDITCGTSLQTDTYNFQIERILMY